MIIRRCDRCGAEFRPAGVYDKISLPVSVYEGRSNWRDIAPEFLGMKTQGMDLCLSCCTELERLIEQWLLAPAAEK